MGGTPLAPDIRRAPYFQSLSQCYRFDNRHPGCKQGTSRGPQRRREPHKHRKVSHLCAVEPAIQIVSYQSCATSWDDWVGKEQACRSRRPLRAQKKRTREWRVLCTPSLREGRERCKGNRRSGEYESHAEERWSGQLRGGQLRGGQLKSGQRKNGQR